MQVGIYLHKRDYELDARALIRKVFQQYFGSGGGAREARQLLKLCERAHLVSPHRLAILC